MLHTGSLRREPDHRQESAKTEILASFPGIGPLLGAEFLVSVGDLCAFSSLRTTPASRAFYDRKRAEGKTHHQALIALARRRVNVLRAMLRDGTTFAPPLMA